MKHSWLRRGSFLPLLALIFLVLSPTPLQAQAAGGLAMSGNFYRQHFELIPGQVVSTPDIYVTVINQGEDDLRIQLTTTAPIGVEIILNASEFTLAGGESQRVEVGIKVGLQVAPGEYDLAVTAEGCPEGEGIKIAAGSQQQARLTVFAEAGEVEIYTTSPQGEPFPAIIRLYKQIEGQNLPCGYSETGELKSKLTPGDYLVEAYYKGAKVAEQTFSLAADEKKTINLVPQTVFIEGFAVAPKYYAETGEFALIKIVYTINNIYQPLKDVTAVLKVSFEDELVEETELISMPTLDVGITANSYNYVPTEYWQKGTYSFKIELYVQGELYTQSSEIETVVEPTLKVSAPINWPLIGGIIAGVVVIILLVILLWRRRQY